MLAQHEEIAGTAHWRMGKRLPKVSVMISVFNQLHCLPKALDSALAQDYPDLEVIVGDDCSSDGSGNEWIAGKNETRIKYFRNERNLGMYGNYRRMLKDYSSGDIVVMLNADDYFTDPHFISEAVEILLTDKDVALVFADVKVLVEATGVYYEDKINRDLPKLMEGDRLFINYVKGYSLPHLACIYDRHWALDAGSYGMVGTSEDWGLMLRLMQGRKVGYINRPVGVLCRHGVNVSKNLRYDELFLRDTYIHRVYEFARHRKTFNEKTLARWRDNMLRRHHIKWLVKLWFLNRPQLPAYFQMLRGKYPGVYKSITTDVRYWFFLLIRKYPRLMCWVFKNILKQESFIADLLEYGTHSCQGKGQNAS